MPLQYTTHTVRVRVRVQVLSCRTTFMSIIDSCGSACTRYFPCIVTTHIPPFAHSPLSSVLGFRFSSAATAMRCDSFTLHLRRRPLSSITHATPHQRLLMTRQNLTSLGFQLPSYVESARIPQTMVPRLVRPLVPEPHGSVRTHPNTFVRHRLSRRSSCR